MPRNNPKEPGRTEKQENLQVLLVHNDTEQLGTTENNRKLVVMRS